MKKVICIGSSSKDVFFPTKDGIISETPQDLKSQKKISFELGAKYHVENRHEALGGCAANVASGLSRLGIEVKCYTKIGDDNLGQWIMEELERQKVKTDLLQVEKNTPSDMSAVIVDEKSGERTIFFNRDANENLEIIPGKLDAAQWLFVSALNGNQKESWEQNLDKILEVAKKEIKIAYNPGPENIKTNTLEVIRACRVSEILIVNKDEALEIVSQGKKGLSDNLNDEVFLIKELKKITPGIVAMTDGKRGAWVCAQEEVFFAAATGAYPVETTGAGDAFTSGFLAATIKEKNAEEALKWGIANSGSSVLFYGAHEGLLNEEQIQNNARNIKVEKIA